MTEQYASATPDSSESKRAKLWKVAAIVLAGLYLATIVRMMVSGDWSDHVAWRMVGLITLATGVLLLIAIALAPAPRPQQKRWPIRRKAATVIVIVLVLGGTIRWISTDAGDPLAQVLLQTGALAAMLLSIAGWLPLGSLRR
ncbi:hypothetical protein [Nocardia rhizosphaerihabitans]|uniref:Transmembrane protein n=1 Tax=Nocardia rhizosphaerihabitans TaxID=1691570 RepID=A0ABQ2K4H5_9NOCA|nr:hypothetical protein [Nocardia rhizosphaerihabitans]GGN66000.1 hypothetical protein GCM10011610_00470 [Nocardia rhizosphaerihabitans]